jgi:archaellum biogenesis ATPase FlaH
LDVNLIPQVEDFIKKGKHSVVYMDCFDQITLVKGFENTLTLINDIRNMCQENNSFLLLSVNPKMFNKVQLSFFEKDFLEVN